MTENLNPSQINPPNYSKTFQQLTSCKTNQMTPNNKSQINFI